LLEQPSGNAVSAKLFPDRDILNIAESDFDENREWETPSLPRAILRLGADQ
jgi:hypothetical protein